MKLLEDRNRNRIAVFHQICHHLLHVFRAFFHLVLGPPELNNIAFLGWVWKVDDNLREFVPNLSDPLPLLPDDGAMEPLLDDQILGALVLHAGGELQQLALGLLHALRVALDADQAAPLAVGGMRTDTLYWSLILFMLAPLFPMRCLWNLWSMLIST